MAGVLPAAKPGFCGWATAAVKGQGVEAGVTHCTCDVVWRCSAGGRRNINVGQNWAEKRERICSPLLPPQWVLQALR